MKCASCGVETIPINKNYFFQYDMKIFSCGIKSQAGAASRFVTGCDSQIVKNCHLGART
jgi:hypothetical protein